MKIPNGKVISCFVIILILTSLSKINSDLVIKNIDNQLPLSYQEEINSFKLALIERSPIYIDDDFDFISYGFPGIDAFKSAAGPKNKPALR